MSSVLSSASSHVALLAQLTSETTTIERSRSKGLYTFVHYEHSSYPRRWIILFFVIMGVTLALGWLIGGLVRLRQTASYLESCAQGKVQCKSGSGLTCSLSSSLCLCSDGTFWEATSSKCQPVRNRNDPCENNTQCDTKHGLICNVDRTCQCSSNTYSTGAGCIAYASFGAACSSSSVPPCNVQLGLQCDSVTQRCACPSSTYWSYARCESTVSYTGYCNDNATCNSQAGLFCRLPGSYAACDCPLPSKLYTCDCQQGSAWVTASTINSTSACLPQNTFAGNCTSSSQCPQALNLACIGGRCDCSTPLWFWSWTSSQCLPCQSQGYTLIHYQSQWVCTRLISSTLMTYAASRSACNSLGWSLISPIVGADIPIIAQAYPTYRLWMNMQTSLGSSIYTNNLFPTNQSNWNSYVVISLAPNYSVYLYALQLVSSYNTSTLFEGNTNVDTGHALCAFY